MSLKDEVHGEEESERESQFLEEVSAQEGYGEGWNNKTIMGEQKHLELSEDGSCLEGSFRLVISSLKEKMD